MSNSSRRIVHVEPLPDWIRDLYAALAAKASLTIDWVGHVPDEGLAAAVDGAAALVTGKRAISDAVLKAAGDRLKALIVVGRAPWVVDSRGAARAGISVEYVPHLGAIAVAEHTMALLLAVYRKLAAGHLGTVSGAYRELGIRPVRTDERKIAFNWLKLEGVDQLYGKTLGLVGLGDIGLEVARRALAFDMKVLYTKRHPLPPEHEELAGVRFAALDTLLSEADVVSLHAPHTPATEGLINRGALQRMKSSAVLVNTARGGLVDEPALVEALRSGEIAGAGLDVFVDEPLPAAHPLLALDTVTLSPHLGGGTGGGQRGVAHAVLDKIQRHLPPGPS